jgi:hypothetical protein
MTINKEGRLALMAKQRALRSAVAPLGLSTRAKTALAQDDKISGSAKKRVSG